MATVTLPEVRAYIRAMLHKADGSPPLPSFWTPTALLAIEKARTEIDAILLGRGITAAQIEGGAAFKVTWEFQALYWCSQINSDLFGKDVADAMKGFDQREWLKVMPWVVDGAVVTPGATGVRQSGSGSLRWPASGTAKNPLLTDDVARPCRDVPYPSY
jgi:hypothetical protein